MSCEEFPRIGRVRDVARVLDIGLGKAYELIRGGAIPALKVGRQYRITSDAIYQLLHGDNSDPYSAASEQSVERVLGTDSSFRDRFG